VILYIDIETRSRVDLKNSNAYRYVEDPDFAILMAWYAVDDGPLQVALTTEEVLEIPGLFDAEVEKVAHNAPFERICFSEFIRRNEGGDRFDFLDPAEWTDTMVLAGEHGYPRKLELLADALGGEKKDAAGTLLINFFCKPNRKGQFNRPEDHPEKWQQFLEYGRQDVVTLRDVHRRLPGWPTEAERLAYLSDQRINDTGIQVDVDMAKAAIATSDTNAAAQKAEITELTGVENPGSNPQMLAWFRSQGVEIPNMQKDTVAALLTRPEYDEQAFLLGESDISPAKGISPTVRRVLELRQELALVAMKKYTAALDRVNPDGRLRGSFQFFGAHTGRWAGRGVQLQNLPSATIKPDEGIDVDTAIGANVVDLMMGADMDSHTLKALVRAMFTGPFTVVDYSAIEARVLAWLAGEEWALQAFRDGRDLYVETANRMGKGMTRKEGKVAVLALGYNGGVNSLRAMGADGGDEFLQKIVYKWRDANENIVTLWAELEAAFRVGDRSAGDYLYVRKDGADRQLVLPSGRAITYHNCALRPHVDQWGRRKMQIVFTDPAYYPAKTSTYGGRLTENVTQAVARDILSEALVRLHDHGHKVVGHVHDEILVEGFSSVEEVSKIMVEQPTWAEGLPLSAEGFTCPRYRKD
jgi:DNA polymerase bacteriophage-type